MISPIDAKDVLVRTLPTPNPYALKYVVNQPLKREGKATFSSAVEAEPYPLVRDLFAIPGVKQVHLFQNTATVTHTGELPEEILNREVHAILKTRLAVHDADLELETLAAARPSASKQHTDPVLLQIEEILDRTIRPGLQADGGDLEVLGMTDNDVQVMYQGACGGCPSAMMGTLDAIQGILRAELGNEELTVTPL